MKYFVGGVFCTVLALAALVAAETVVAGIYMEHEKVAALFAGKGGEIATGPGYRVSANKRTGTGQVEVHGKETDIFLIIGGEGTFVTGGKMIGGRQSKPEQWLGTSIEGGTTYQVSKGDVFTVPGGTPHWFKEVPN